jgi:esterase/lipase
MALSLSEELLIAFGSAIGGFVALWLFMSYTFSSIAQQMAQTTAIATQSVQNMYTEYINTLLAMHGASSLENHSTNALVNQQQLAKQNQNQPANQGSK